MNFRSALLLLAVFASLSHSAETYSLSQFPGEIQPLVTTYCAKCHGGEETKGDVNLSQYEKTGDVLKDLNLWKNALEQIKAGDMPPAKARQLSEADRAKLAGWLDYVVKSAESGALGKDPGRTTLRRLNRTEYNNTIQDLFGVKFRPADSFPADGSGGAGFDNNADTLFLPPLLMEKYYDAAGQILEAVFASKPTKDRVLSIKPQKGQPEELAARSLLRSWASRAFRRKVEEAELDKYVALFNKSKNAGLSYDDGIKSALKSILLSPYFLFKFEKDQEISIPYKISDFELATRLSYFLWSSTPDLELLQLAARGELSKPEVLENQTRRLLKDPRVRTFSREFSSQWLGSDKLKDQINPDKGRFPEFTPSLRAAMYRESTEFFHSLLAENASLLRLIDADYTFLNEELARHYGIAGVSGAELRRVKLTNPNRGGILGMGAILTTTSLPLRTSPVLRGKWLLEEVLGTPPPPPPQNAGQLPADDRQADGLTLRQRLEQHRTAANCKGCHAKLDPMGFGLENFDAIGRWRQQSDGKPIDSTGTLTTGETFSTPAELKKILLTNKQLIITTIVKRMLGYALGRGMEFYDAPSVKAITDNLLQNDCRAELLVLEIVRSYPFQHRRNDPALKID